MKKVLIVEAVPFWRKDFSEALAGRKDAMVIFAPSFEQARWQISRGPIDVLIFDENCGSGHVEEIVQMDNLTLAKPVAFLTGDCNLGERLVRAGICGMWTHRSRFACLLDELFPELAQATAISLSSKVGC